MNQRYDWTAAGAWEVAEDVFRVPLPMPEDGARAVNVYVLRTADGLVLVDGGWAVPAAREAMLAALAQLGASPGDITRFLVTHVHRDHYSLAVWIRRQFGAVVSLGRGEMPMLRRLRDPRNRSLGVYLDLLPELGGSSLADRLLADGLGDDGNTDAGWAEDPDDWLEEGPVALAGGRVLHAVATSGHTTGHLVFHDVDNALLFAGDHVLSRTTPTAEVDENLSAAPLRAFLRSLAIVRARPDAVLLPAHGPVGPSVQERIDALVAHHEERLATIEKLATTRATSPVEVADGMRWTRRRLPASSLGPMQAMLAVFETAAHLELLVAQGRLTVRLEDGVRRYR